MKANQTRNVNLYKTKIKNVAIVYRRGTHEALSAARELTAWLRERKIRVFTQSDQRVAGAAAIKDPSNLQLVVVLGGDGTYLEAVRMLKDNRVPLLGVNMGGLGFLTVSRVQDLYTLVESALAGRLEIKSRAMLKISVRNGNKILGDYVALNDLVIERGPLSHLIHIAMTVDRLPITSIKADGLIVATPTGSSAYNLAAGGPILHPEVEAWVVTPICPHSLTSRPFIFPDSRKIQFTIVGNRNRAVLTVDGIKVAKIGPSDEVWLERHEHNHLFLRKVGHNYFSLLKEKLKFGERA
jgi:NAD+ kinase